MPYDAAEWRRKMNELYKRDIKDKRDPPGRDEYGKWNRPEYRPVDKNIGKPSAPLRERIEQYRPAEQKISSDDIRSEETKRLELERKLREELESH